ncbi:MAG: HAD hydrolase-like protein [Calditrichaeota bacterium]|nr:HAD hydrolase-like protein [Calditrichota bacterium]
MKLDLFKTFVFDCDGVILDSNKIKSEAFYELGLPFGADIAEEFVDYHKAHGGISRFHKVAYLHAELLGKTNCQEEIEAGIKRYGELVREKLLTCEMTKGFGDFIRSLPEAAYKIVVSGGFQSELRDVFAALGLDPYFDGIFGSPDTKSEILTRQRQDSRFASPAIYFGDSRLDYEAANEFDMDFLFLSQYTELNDWEGFCREHELRHILNWTCLNETTLAESGQS